jgi:hypothetical protein
VNIYLPESLPISRQKNLSLVYNAVSH